MFMNRLSRWLDSLRFPTLVIITAALFAIDLVIPDAVPFIDEIMLALATIFFSRFKQRGSRDKPGSNDKE